MALTTQTMTDEQRKSVAIEYLKAFDNGGTTSTGGSILDLFADDAQVYFPKWGLANGKENIGKLFGDVGATLKGITHHFSHFNWIFGGSDTIVAAAPGAGEGEGANTRAWMLRGATASPIRSNRAPSNEAMKTEPSASVHASRPTSSRMDALGSILRSVSA